MNAVRQPLVTLSERMEVVSANRAFLALFDVEPAAIRGRRLYDLGEGRWRIPALRELLEDVLPRETSSEDLEVTLELEGGGRQTLILNACEVRRKSGEARLILLAVQKVTRDGSRVEET